MTLHFGLGSHAFVSSIEVRWPAGGPVRTLTNVPIRTAWTVHPPSRLGDVDGDGVVGLAGWTQFAAYGAAYGTGTVTPGREMLDFDGNFSIDAADIAAFWSRASVRSGDRDGGGAVGAADLAVLLSAWGA